jgi:hypothetical protein|tara:strand:+ start:935 stop:1915 length:981 start_codon:yes stop_codon:yes gene_type:complete
MSNVAEEQEFKEETVAEALASAQQDVENESPETQDVDSFEIEVVDDTPEEDQGKPRRAENAEPQIPSDDEVEKYSEGVQKRIKQLKFEFHEERRAKEEAARLQEEALRYAETIKAENEKLRKNLDDGEQTLIGQAKGRIEAQLEKAKREYKAAYESGDPDALLKAQEDLTTIQNEKYRVDNYQPRSRVAEKPPEPAPQPPAQPPQVDQKALEWGKKNEWFEKDPEMTGYAYGLHQKLVNQGIDPRTDQYYDEIDKAVRRVFPDKFDDGKIEEEAPQRQNGPVVAAPSKTTKKPRTVRLTSTQAALAKRLGLTNEQYAAQLMKEASK